MVQREIKRKIQVYGVIAVLSALTLGALCYNFGAVPFLPSATALQRFSSYAELKNFLSTNAQTQGAFPYYGALDAAVLESKGATPVPAPSPRGETNYGVDYSTTNIQVAGVDEADMVKTDGKYLYSVANDSVFIMEAYPPENAALLSKITFNKTYLAGIFISADSNKLAVLGSEYSLYDELIRKDVYPYGALETYFTEGVKTFIKVYDISNKSNPVLARDFAMSGSYFNSRMIDEYVYAVISQPAYVINETVVLPKIYTGDRTEFMSASQVYYSNVTDYYFTYTTVIALNILQDAQEPTEMTVMMGGTSNMYVSLSNIYVTFPSSEGQTSIYRIRIEKDNLNTEAQGKVPGYVLNQFSMDEYKGYFRIATTSWKETLQNNVYVLNMNLSIVGKLENLGVKENLHSARFMGDKCYLVTFKTIDPLFVIDLGKPTDPKVLGELKIPGYSDYLHPYDETHIIGVGKETIEADQGDFVWYQGVKISLFDVSNVSDPKQLAKYIIGDRGTDSPILRDHRAFLFDKSRNLLVIPVLVAEINETLYPKGVPAYGEPVWQGAYVFNLTLTEGFVLKGKITHLRSSADLQNTSYWINRALYIEDVLYTVSDEKVKLNSLENLAFITEIELG